MTAMDSAPGQDGLDLALRRELETGEFVRWQGRPISRIRLSEFTIWVFAVPWTAFALFWTFMAYVAVDSMKSGWGWAFPIFGLPFICVGFGMLSKPFWPLYLARRTLFAITHQRVIRLRLSRKLDVLSLPANAIGVMQRTENRDGSGTLRILMRKWRDSDGDAQTEWFELGEVADILRVEKQLLGIAENAPPPRTDASSKPNTPPLPEFSS